MDFKVDVKIEGDILDSLWLVVQVLNNTRDEAFLDVVPMTSRDVHVNREASWDEQNDDIKAEVLEVASGEREGKMLAGKIKGRLMGRGYKILP